MDNRPWSEQWYDTAKQWAELEAAASLLEESKSAVMAQRQSMLGDIPVNRAEQIVKASPEWEEHLIAISDARKAANLAKVEMEYLRMKFMEWNNTEANHRAGTRL